MASKRALAVKQATIQQDVAERLAAIERNQALIMAALKIGVPGVQDEAVVPKSKPQK